MYWVQTREADVSCDLENKVDGSAHGSCWYWSAVMGTKQSACLPQDVEHMCCKDAAVGCVIQLVVLCLGLFVC